MKKQIKLIILFSTLLLFMFFFVSSMWALDIGVSVLNIENSGGSAVAQGLDFVRDGSTQYHIGLTLVGLIFIIQSIVFVYYIIIKEVKNESAQKKV